MGHHPAAAVATVLRPRHQVDTAHPTRVDMAVLLPVAAMAVPPRVATAVLQLVALLPAAAMVLRLRAATANRAGSALSLRQQVASAVCPAAVLQSSQAALVAAPSVRRGTR